MDIAKFQAKLEEICALGEANGKKLEPVQVKEAFEGMELDKTQLLKVLQYLKLKGIAIEGLENREEKEEEEKPEKEVKVPLTPEEEGYLKEYLEGIEAAEKSCRTSEELFAALAEGDMMAQAELSQRYLAHAARMAAEMNCEEINLADLIQEANVSLLMALGEETEGAKDEKWLLGRIRAGIRGAIEIQTQRKFEDDYLVAKVEKLESAVKELTEDEEDGESKFSIDELAIILDMDADEIRDVLRLTGDDK